MKTLQVHLYKFNELSDDAKQKAIQQYRDNNHEIFWQEELIDSLKAVFKTANITLKNYELGLCSYSFLTIDIDDQIADLTGARALGWLENNLLCKLRITRADYLKNRKDNFRYGYRIGKIKDCPLTGYCADDDYLTDLQQSIRSGSTLKEAFSSLADTYVRLLQAEYDDQNSDEYISEHLEINEYDFTENGKLY